jgi:hypothetical protein
MKQQDFETALGIPAFGAAKWPGTDRNNFPTFSEY